MFLLSQAVSVIFYRSESHQSVAEQIQRLSALPVKHTNSNVQDGPKSKPGYCCNTFGYCQTPFTIFGTCTLGPIGNL